MSLSTYRRALREEMPPMLRLAGPVVLAELGWMGMGAVDTMMLGRLSRDALAGASVGDALHHSVALVGVGLLLGLDTLVAQAFGAGKQRDCDHSVRQGVWLAVLLSLPLMGLIALTPPLMRAWGVAEDVYVQAVAYLNAVNYSTPPLLVYAAFRRYLQAVGLVHPVMFALLSANLVNVGGNWILIYGNLGAPALGTAGSAWSTVIARAYMAAVLVGYVAWRQWKTRAGPLRGSWRPDVTRMRELLRLGGPAAGQIGLEAGVFSLASVLAATLSTLASAAHQIALNIAGLTFMVPLGISSAGAVRVGHAMGAGDPAAARRSGWTALVLGCAFMSAAGLAFFAIPRTIVGIYTDDSGVIAVGVWLLFVAAFFQLFDGLQVVATGILRGLGDTRTAMLTNLAGHWLFGLPAGYLLCFHAGLGVIGLWIGLSMGLIAVAVVLVLAWRRKSARLTLLCAATSR